MHPLNCALLEVRDLEATNPELAAAARHMMEDVLCRAATDPEFRRWLVADSRGAISELIGRELPESFNVAFIENHADATIVLPDIVAAELAYAAN